jgi:hypothetical protein
MFHFNEGNDSSDVTDVSSLEKSKRLVALAFANASSHRDKRLLFKTDFKVAWLYLFGYKISKVYLFIKTAHYSNLGLHFETLYLIFCFNSSMN